MRKRLWLGIGMHSHLRVRYYYSAGVIVYLHSATRYLISTHHPVTLQCQIIGMLALYQLPVFSYLGQTMTATTPKAVTINSSTLYLYSSDHHHYNNFY